VPVLKDGELTVWDSLAISEYVADRFPQANLWPADPARGRWPAPRRARCTPGFRSLRGELPMNLVLREHRTLTPDHPGGRQAGGPLWTQLRRRFPEGPFLVGEWSIADAFFTPVATRLRTYGVLPSDFGDDGSAGAYAETLLEQPEFLEWEKAALEDVGQGA
jgi:glutathione S-transferase